MKSDPLIGQVIGGRYQVTRIIGKGGMGAIYEVQHVKLRRSFALKKLSPQLADDAEALARFQREADVVASLRHPNVVEVVDWETLEDGSPCMILELLRGEDLHARLSGGGPLPWARLGAIADAALAALAVAHKAGIVHRDLKPQNIFLAVDDAGDEHVKLLDFGVSKIRGSESLLTADQKLIGTPLYMAPEQADGRQDLVGPATDVWAMGAILYEMATGEPAFAAPSTPSILYRICHGDPNPLRERRPDAPERFVRLLERALSRDPTARIGTIEELRRELRDSLVGVASLSAAVPAEKPRPHAISEGPRTTLSGATGQTSSPSLARSGRWRWSAAAIVLAGGVAAAVLWSRQPLPAHTLPSSPPATAPAPLPSVTALRAAAPAARSIRLVVTPADAQVWLDGDAVTGDRLPLPVDAQIHQLRLSASGYHGQVRALDAATPELLEIKLQPLSKPAHHAKPAGPKPIDP